MLPLQTAASLYLKDVVLLLLAGRCSFSDSSSDRCNDLEASCCYPFHVQLPLALVHVGKRSLT